MKYAIYNCPCGLILYIAKEDNEREYECPSCKEKIKLCK